MVAPSDFLTPPALEDFRGYLAERGGITMFAQARHTFLMRALSSWKLRSFLRLTRDVDGLRATRWRYSKPISESSLMFHWAMEVLRDRYRSALGHLE